MTTKRKVELFLLGTQLQLISCLNLIETEESKNQHCDRFCILTNRLNSSDIQGKLKSLGIFKEIYTICWDKPYLKDWLRKEDLREEYSFVEICRGTFNFNHDKIFKKIIASKFSGIIEVITKVSDFFFHNNNVFVQAILSHLSSDCVLHLIDEGISSYSSDSLQRQVDFIHLYEPNLITCDLSTVAAKIVSLQKISLDRHQLIHWISTIFPIKEKIEYKGIVFFDQPLGAKPRSVLRHFSHRYSLLAREFEVRCRLIEKIAKEHPSTTIYVREHPAEKAGLQNFIKSDNIKFIKSSPIPFELYILFKHCHSSNFYSIYSSATCYWQIMFPQEFVDSLNISVNLFYIEFMNTTGIKYELDVDKFYKNLQKIHPSVFHIF